MQRISLFLALIAAFATDKYQCQALAESAQAGVEYKFLAAIPWNANQINVRVYGNEYVKDSLAITPLASFQNPANARVVSGNIVFANIEMAPVALKETVARIMTERLKSDQVYGTTKFRSEGIIAMPLSTFQMKVEYPEIRAVWLKKGAGNALKLQDIERGMWKCESAEDAELLATCINDGSASFEMSCSWEGLKIKQASVKVTGKAFADERLNKHISNVNGSLYSDDQFFTYKQLGEIVATVRENVNMTTFVEEGINEAFSDDQQFELLTSCINRLTSHIENIQAKQTEHGDIFIGNESFSPDRIESESSKISEELTQSIDAMATELYERSNQGTSTSNISSFSSEFRRHRASGSAGGSYFAVSGNIEGDSDYLKSFVNKNQSQKKNAWLNKCKKHIAQRLNVYLKRNSFRSFEWDGLKLIPKAFSLYQIQQSAIDAETTIAAVKRYATRGQGSLVESRYATVSELNEVSLAFGNTQMEFVNVPQGSFYDNGSQINVPSYFISTTKVPFGAFADFVKDTGFKTVAEKASDGQNPFSTNSFMGNYGQSEINSLLDKYSTRPEDFYGVGLLGGTRQSKKDFSWRTIGYDQTNNHPVVNITYSDMLAFCSWLSKREQRVFRLPSAIEYYYATSDVSRTQQEDYVAIWKNIAKPIEAGGLWTTVSGLGELTQFGLKDTGYNAEE